MKHFKTLAAMYLMYISAAFGQLDESKNFLYLYSDSVIYANRINLRRDFSGSLYFTVDSKIFHPEQVKFFNNYRGFFANVKDATFNGETAFSERIRKGKLNLFEEKTFTWEYDDDGDVYGRRYRERPQVSAVRNYYNIDYGKLKKATYANLSKDLAGNPESIQLLNKYESVKKAKIGLYVGAGASLLAGLITFVSGGSKSTDLQHGFNSGSKEFTGGVILLGLGTGLATGGYLLSVSEPKYLKAAIDSYND
ncbi:hypothetical protein [Arcticibacter tournemirensis]|uniref:Uncharacterized protein n=1 Tax=Arcticibacter tournemirensis TaxID=699437 RepID=A0A4Q0MBU7_9SPHI|nr:hypothetical protein [Arcticibacter tournemirensis]RXF70654.1 hypothetical protein EKH83_08430 [Arcticibacter tournemirensis]